MFDDVVVIGIELQYGSNSFHFCWIVLDYICLHE